MTTYNCEIAPRSSRAAVQGNYFSNLAAMMSNALIRAADYLVDGLEQRRSVQHLQSLDDRLLRDIGLSRSDVESPVSDQR